MVSRLEQGVRRMPDKHYAAQAPRSMGGPRLPYLPGLDGLRALAVIAVLLYHAAVSWLPGGFLGVEVFFVISGYLITSLLLDEWHQNGRIDLVGFWLRRARRLLPAAFFLVIATLAYAAVFLPWELSGLRDDALAAFAYVTNWYLVFDHQSYFQAVVRPSLLRHLWSLAVEEQFYLLWPLLFVLGLRRWGPRLLLGAVLAGALGSSLLMGLLYQPDVDPSRLYYGTDTRAAGLLVGVALAFVWVPGHTPVRWQRLPFDLVGLAAFGALVVCGLRLAEYDPFLYHGGFALVALATAAAIAAVVHPRARLFGAVLSWKPLRWLGTRSYGLYLWHWPIFSLTRPQLDLPLDGLPLLALRLGATLLLSELSYRLVETPIRTGALVRSWRAYRRTSGRRHLWQGLRWAASAATVATLTVTLSVSVANAQPPAAPSYLAASSINTIELAPRPEATVILAAPTATPQATPTALAPAVPMATPAAPTTTEEEATATPLPTGMPAGPTATAAATASPTPAQPAPPAPRPGTLPASLDGESRGGRVTAIGDSVLLGANEALRGALGRVEIDAAIGRQVYTAVDILRALAANGQLGDVVIIHLGNNGTFSARQFDEIMSLAGDSRRVVFVNVKVPRPWEASVNATLAEGGQRYANATMVDWHSVGGAQPELFWDDGIHLRPEGARVYANLIAAAIAGAREAPAAGKGAY